MTEKIKSAIRTFNQLLFLGKVDLPKEEIESNIETAIECMEKQIPMEHHHTRIDHIVNPVRMSVCPSCLAVIPSHRTEYPNYCIRCGQHIDWSDKE